MSAWKRSGSPTVFGQAFYARDLAGRVVQVGVPTPEMSSRLPMIDFFGRGGALKPSWYGDCLPSRDFPMFVDLYLPGPRWTSTSSSARPSGEIDDVEAAFQRMGRGEVLRSVVVTPVAARSPYEQTPSKALRGGVVEENGAT